MYFCEGCEIRTSEISGNSTNSNQPVIERKDGMNRLISDYGDTSNFLRGLPARSYYRCTLLEDTQTKRRVSMLTKDTVHGLITLLGWGMKFRLFQTSQQQGNQMWWFFTQKQAKSAICPGQPPFEQLYEENTMPYILYCSITCTMRLCTLCC